MRRPDRGAPQGLLGAPRTPGPRPTFKPVRDPGGDARDDPVEEHHRHPVTTTGRDVHHNPGHQRPHRGREHHDQTPQAHRPRDPKPQQLPKPQHDHQRHPKRDATRPTAEPPPGKSKSPVTTATTPPPSHGRGDGHEEDENRPDQALHPDQTRRRPTRQPGSNRPTIHLDPGQESIPDPTDHPGKIK